MVGVAGCAGRSGLVRNVDPWLKIIPEAILTRLRGNLVGGAGCAGSERAGYERGPMVEVG